jgi:hypothetical protein
MNAAKSLIEIMQNREAVKAARHNRRDTIRRRVAALRELEATQPNYARHRLQGLERAARYWGVW